MLALTTSCGKNANQWTIDGTVTGADGKELIVESQTFVGWQGVDTVTLDQKGNFSISSDAKGYPSIFRLRIDGATIYFPVDSIETLHFEGSLPDIERNYTLSGTPDAEMIMAVDHRIADAVGKMGVDKAVGDSAFKRSLADQLLTNPGSVVAYYIVSKQIGGKPIFNPLDKTDLRVIGAVANAYANERPADPRTSQLSDIYLAGRKANSNRADTIMAQAIGYHDISLYDNKGRESKLSQTVDNANLTLLNFTAYGAEESAAFNRQLNQIYEKFRSRGLQIYQVAVDEDEMSWRTAAENLPWTTVRNAGAGANQNLINYNVVGLPTTFIINGNGDLVERVDNVDRLQSAVAKHF